MTPTYSVRVHTLAVGYGLFDFFSKRMIGKLRIADKLHGGYNKHFYKLKELSLQKENEQQLLKLFAEK